MRRNLAAKRRLAQIRAYKTIFLSFVVALSITGADLHLAASAQAVKDDLMVIERVVEKEVVKIVEVEKPIDRPVKCDTEKCRILAYIVEKFQDDAANAITMIRKCENSSFDPRRVSGLNIQKSGRRSYDVGIFQINVDEENLDEIEKLKGWRYNIDQAYAKYKAHNNTFYLWTCGYVVGDYTYVDKLQGK
jgi:hypothetical protein